MNPADFKAWSTDVGALVSFGHECWEHLVNDWNIRYFEMLCDTSGVVW